MTLYSQVTQLSSEQKSWLTISKTYFYVAHIFVREMEIKTKQRDSIDFLKILPGCTEKRFLYLSSTKRWT